MAIRVRQFMKERCSRCSRWRAWSIFRSMEFTMNLSTFRSPLYRAKNAPGVDYEAFNTSGGVGTLCETLRGKVRTLNYKTIRYRGHRDLIAFLMNELRLNARRPLLKEILESAVPVTPQDVVLIFCTVSGWKDGLLTQI